MNSGQITTVTGKTTRRTYKNIFLFLTTSRESTVYISRTVGDIQLTAATVWSSKDLTSMDLDGSHQPPIESLPKSKSFPPLNTLRDSDQTKKRKNKITACVLK